MYLVYGGEIDLEADEFLLGQSLKVVGLFFQYEDAYKAWRGASYQTVDTAIMRFYIRPVAHYGNVWPPNETVV